MLSVITETGDRIELDSALVVKGDAAVEAYVLEQRKQLGLPDTPLHGEKDAKKIEAILKKRAPVTIEAPTPPAEPPAPADPQED